MDITEVTLRFLSLYGPLALFCFTFLETSMLFPLLPSEVVVPAAAALLIGDFISFLVFVSAATVGGTLGAFVPFYVCRDTRIGEFNWLQDRITISDEQLNRGEEWFQRWGQSSVLWGRFLPVLRSVISIPAGFANMNSLRFGIYTALGTVGFYAATGGLVYYGHQQALFAAIISFATTSPATATVVVLTLLGLGVLVRRWVTLATR